VEYSFKYWLTYVVIAVLAFTAVVQVGGREVFG
jgi:hypothetical protein